MTKFENPESPFEAIPDRILFDLIDENNQTWQGTLQQGNSSLMDVILQNVQQPDKTNISDSPSISDPKGAGTFIIAVLLVYGLGICLTVMYHVFANKHEQDFTSQENEKELDKYLKETATATFQWYTDKERIRRCKRKILSVVNMDKLFTRREDKMTESDTEDFRDEGDIPTTPLLSQGIMSSAQEVFIEEESDNIDNDSEDEHADKTENLSSRIEQNVTNTLEDEVVIHQMTRTD